MFSTEIPKSVTILSTTTFDEIEKRNADPKTPREEKTSIIATTQIFNPAVRVEQVRSDRGFEFATLIKGRAIELCPAVQIDGIVYIPRVDGIALDPNAISIPPVPHSERQDPETLFDDVLKFHRDYVTVPKHYDVLDVGFALASWRFHAFTWFPYIRIVCPQERGKTRVLDVMCPICYHAMNLGNMPAAIVYRAVELYDTTFLADEVSGKLDKEVNEAFRLGTKWNGRILKNVYDEHSGDYVPRSYACYSPKILVGQDAPTDDRLSSRSFSQNMAHAYRAAHVPDDIEVDSTFYSRAKDLGSRLLRYGFDNSWVRAAERPKEITNDRQWQGMKAILSSTPAKYHDDLLAIIEIQRETILNDRASSPQGDLIRALVELGRPKEAEVYTVYNAVNRIRKTAVIPGKVEHDDAGNIVKETPNRWDTKHPQYLSPEMTGRLLAGLGFDRVRRQHDGRRFRHFPSDELARLELEYFPRPKSDAELELEEEEEE